MDNFNLRTFLAEGKLSSEMQFDSDIEGKTNKNDFAFWYRAGARGKAQALKAQELLQQNGIDADYSKGPFYIDFSNAGVEQRVVHQMLRDAGLTNFVVSNVSEGQLNEAMSPQDVVDIADTVAEEFTIESAEEGDFLVYSVGRMEGMSFELDTDLTSQSPKNIDMRGVGEGWGGIFRIKPTEDGYEVRNAEKGGLVAMIDAMGNFKMLSADESRAEMGLEENKEETKSNKMKKSELKEMIKAAMLAEMEVEETEVYEAEEDEEVDVKAEETEDVETTDVAVDDTETVDVEAESEISPEVKATQDALTAAIEAAKALGDQKLADQIGNSITFFTRTHVVGKGQVAEEVNEETKRMQKLAGIKK